MMVNKAAIGGRYVAIVPSTVATDKPSMIVFVGSLICCIRLPFSWIVGASILGCARILSPLVAREPWLSSQSTICG
jgi:hypothetical protein